MTTRPCGLPAVGGFPPIIKRCSTLVILVFCTFLHLWAGEMQFKMVRQINLQQTAPHGSYGTGFLLVGTPAQNLFSTRLASDQSLLILNPDTSGEWPLVRVRDWWTDAPSTEALKVPGWTKARCQKHG